MSDLLSTQIYDNNPVSLPLRVSTNVKLIHLRPHILLSGAFSSGQVYVSIKQGELELTRTNLELTDMLEVKTSSEHARGYFRFDVNTALNHNTEEAFSEYTIEIGTSGVAFDEVNLISILSDFNQVAELHDTDSKAAYNIELYTI